MELLPTGKNLNFHLMFTTLLIFALMTFGIYFDIKKMLSTVMEINPR